MKRQILAAFIDIFVVLIGLISLIAPFIFSQTESNTLRTTTFPIMISLIIFLSLVLMFYEAQTSALDSKMVAFLGVLIAINAGLRFLENAIPGPAGFSPTFFLIILVGYLFGSRIGFIMGAMTMFISGLITGGIGPWLPGQMITAGWVGQSTAILSKPIQKFGLIGGKSEVILLAIFSAFWGMLYGVIMNLWFWPFLGAGFGQSWIQHGGLIENLGRYTAYYLTTSIVWDITRSIGNVLIMSTMGRPFLKIFHRFVQKFSFQYDNQGSK